MTDTCGCCEGLEPLTPLPTANRPGLERLSYRIGTHATFLETMKARLSGSDLSALKGLKTRDSSDPTIALLDAWALIADVLTFYQERIANEGYLRTATERRSVLELGRLVGYTLRPGVSATVYPAFKMEPGVDKGGEIPKGTRVQSIPGPGEMPQFFETSERITARQAWNELKPRLTQPQTIDLSIPEEGNSSINTQTLYFQGTATNLKANDLLLLVIDGTPIVRHVKAVEPDSAANRTKVILQESPTSPLSERRSDRSRSERRLARPDRSERARSVSISDGGSREDSNDNQDDGNQDREIDCAFEKLNPLLEPLTRKPSQTPANRQRLDRSPQQTFKCQSDMPSRILAALQPRLSDSLYPAWANLPITASAPLAVHALRTKAAPFGHNAPLRPDHYDDDRSMVLYGEWEINDPLNQSSIEPQRLSANFRVMQENEDVISSAEAGVVVQMVNESTTGEGITYSWSFGDGSNSQEQNPSHTFTIGGSFIITLNVSGRMGSATARVTLRVNNPPPSPSTNPR